MAQNNQPYWERRNIKAEKRINDGALRVEEAVVQAYRQAQNYLTQKVRKLFARSEQRSGLSEDEVKAILNQKTSIDELVELRKLANQIKDHELQASAKNRLQALAYKERITRAEDLKAKSFLVSKQIADVQLEKQTDFYIDVIHDSYKEAVAEDYIQRFEEKGITFEIWNKSSFEKKGHELKELSTRYTKNILDSHWHGSNYSKRIWGDTEALAARLEELFTVESMTGMSEFEMAKAIAKEFDRSIGVARRLIRTEANYMANQAKLKAWRDQGVERYVLVAVLDLRTSKICKEKDQKIYLVKEAIVNGAEGTYPPFHPWCRTIAIAYNPRTSKITRIALDPISGETMPIKGDTTYDEWMDKLKEKYSDDEIKLQKKKIKNAAKDNADYRNLKKVLGKENAPKTLDKYQNIKYNGDKQWDQLKKTYRDIKWMEASLKKRTKLLKTDTIRSLPSEAAPNSVTDLFIGKKLEQRRFYGRTGKPRLDIDFSDHKRPDKHPVVPHAHSWTYRERTNNHFIVSRDSGWRELTIAEKIITEKELMNHEN